MCTVYLQGGGGGQGWLPQNVVHGGMMGFCGTLVPPLTECCLLTQFVYIQLYLAQFNALLIWRALSSSDGQFPVVLINEGLMCWGQDFLLNAKVHFH